MAKQFWKGSTLLAPVPAALVTCGTMEQPNVLTIGWTGIVCTRPPMTYISVRPERHSHDIIKASGEFVINLTTSAMCRETDFCGYIEPGIKYYFDNGSNIRNYFKYRPTNFNLQIGIRLQGF